MKVVPSPSPLPVVAHQSRAACGTVARRAYDDTHSLLNTAIARELQVSIQYMFQHAIGAGQDLSVSGKTQSAKRSKFVASHAAYWMPGATLKKIAIAEMRHAEAIAERVVHLEENR